MPNAEREAGACTAGTMLPGDVIQIVEGHHWAPALAIVSELRSWGVQAYVLIPHNDDSAPGQAYIRIPQGQYERIGKAVLMTQSDADGRARTIAALALVSQP